MDLDADFKFVPLPPIAPASPGPALGEAARFAAPVDASIPIHPFPSIHPALPNPLGQPGLKTSFPVAERTFPELNLSIPSTFRLLDRGVTQAMVIDPNSVLTAALAGETS